MHDILYWSNRRVLVTGGSAGLGRALALRLAQAGAHVVVVARDAARLEDLSHQHPRIHTIAADVADKRAIHKIAGEAAAILGGIDVLINNASYLGATPLRLLLDSDCEDLEQAFQTNVLAPFRLSKAVLPGMLLAGEGLIVNVSSDAAMQAYERWGGYAASKAANDQLSRIFDAELRQRGVRSLAFDPGDMATGMHFAAVPDANPDDLYKPDDVARDLLAFLPRAVERNEARYGASQWRAVQRELARSQAERLVAQGGFR